MCSGSYRSGACMEMKFRVLLWRETVMKVERTHFAARKVKGLPKGTAEFEQAVPITVKGCAIISTNGCLFH
jgi:hypothetical protein